MNYDWNVNYLINYNDDDRNAHENNRQDHHVDMYI